MITLGIGTPFIDDLTNPAGCNKPKAVALELNPDSFCLPATVQVVASGGTAPYTYSWNGGLNEPNATKTVAAGSEGIVKVTDANGQVAYAKYDTKQKPRFKGIYKKVNSCSQAEPDQTGNITITDIENGIQGSTYTMALVRTFDATTNTYGNTVVASPPTFILDYAASWVSATLTPGNYTLTITDENGCSTQLVFTICDSCTETSSEYEDQVGGCGCCGGSDCVDDTSVNITDGVN